ncbi:MAG: methylaspartate mutase subunit E, partial [Peptostreptococcaceae bacterium]
LSKATKVIVKTPHEALGVPTMEANAQGLLCTKQILSMLKDQVFNTNEVAIEKEIICAETRCIVDKCFEIGEGDIALGTIRAFKSGILDIPFAPSVHTLGKILPARDNNGAIRILNSGRLPFTKEILDFNNKKIEERAAFENREKSFQMVIDDVYAISKGTLIGRPRNK